MALQKAPPVSKCSLVNSYIERGNALPAAVKKGRHFVGVLIFNSRQYSQFDWALLFYQNLVLFQFRGESGGGGDHKRYFDPHLDMVAPWQR